MLFTVITINYNNCKGLYQTIESVLGQTCRNFEYIIIDGGSNDGSVDLIKEYGKKISYWCSEKDRGIYHAMNKGVAQAHGDYCIFMNSGDRFYDNMVLDQIAEIHAEESIIVGKVSIDDEDNIISPPPHGELTFYHLYSGAIPHQGAFIKTSLLHKYPYDERLRIASDWKFFVQTLIMANCSIRYLNVYVACYDLNGLSSSNPELMQTEKQNVLAELLPPRVLADYKRMKQSECLVQSITPQLKINYGVDKLLYNIGKILLKIRRK